MSDKIQYIDMFNIKEKLESLGFKYQDDTDANFIIIDLAHALEKALASPVNLKKLSKKERNSRIKKLEAVAKAAGPACELLGLTSSNLDFKTLKIYGNLFESLEQLKKK